MLNRTKDIIRTKFLPVAGRVIPELKDSLQRFLDREDSADQKEHLLADPDVPEVIKDTILKTVLFISCFRERFSEKASPAFADFLAAYDRWKANGHRNDEYRGLAIDAAHRFTPVLKQETKEQALIYADICMSQLAGFIVYASQLGYRMDQDDLLSLKKTHQLRDAIKQNTPDVYSQSLELDALTQDIADRMIEKAAAMNGRDLSKFEGWKPRQDKQSSD